MLSILIKDIQHFFSTTIGYLTIAVFLIVNGLFLWVFDGDNNIFNYGFAELTAFFQLAPWVLLFLVPAVTMRSIAEERRLGTIELLLTKPISTLNLVLGKYLASFILIIIAILPTLIYIYTITTLKSDASIVDTGVILASYLGLCLLATSYVAIGLFASSITQNQLVAFIVAILLCFLCFYAFQGLSQQSLQSAGFDWSYLGLYYHYQNLGFGVIDTKSVLFMLSFSILFIYLTVFNVKNYTN